jgi:large subunit ribosomal protein L25
MTELVLKAEAREGLGKEANKKLRKLGTIPAVLYQKQEAQSIQVNMLEFAHILRAGEQLIELSVNGKKKKALIKDVQYHPVTENILHIDFQAVSMSEVIQLSVPLNFIGTPEGIKEGGMFDVHMHELEIKCKASDIPHQLDVEVEALNIGDSLHVADLNFGDLEIVSSPDQLVATVAVPKVYEEPEAEEVEGEGEEGEEGEESTEGAEEASEE